MMRFVRIILSLSIFVLLFIEFFHPLTAITQDLGRHIKTGEIILQTHSVPKINLFSYTYPNFPFINTHWLSEVVFYWIFKLTGFQGLLVFTTLISITGFTILFFSVKRQASGKILGYYDTRILREERKNGNKPFPLLISQYLNIPISPPFTLYACVITSLLYLGILSERTDVRPEIFSFLFLAIFISVLYKYREKYTPLIFILPILELLWVNMHIYFIVGEILIGLFMFEKIICKVRVFVIPSDPERQSNEESRNLERSLHALSLGSPRYRFGEAGRDDNSQLVILFSVFLFSFLASLLNPNGIKGALYPFTVFNNYGYTIQENQNIFFLLQFGSNPTITFFLITALLLFFLLIINYRKSRLIDWLLAIMFTYLAASAIRNFVLFVFVTFLPFSYSLLSILYVIARNEVTKQSRKDQQTGLLHPSVHSGFAMTYVSIVFILSLLIIWQGYIFISQRYFGWVVPSGAQPAADFFLQNHLKGPIFNNFDIGSYLDYRFYPQERVFVDGRPEAYPASFFQKKYIPMQNDPYIFAQQEKKYSFNSIFFEHTDQTPWAANFIKSVMNNPDWKPVYLDNSVVILVKDIEHNKELIKNFGMDKNSIKVSNLQSNNLTQLLYLANFFINTGWLNQEAKIDQKILALDQNNCVALSRLATIYSLENNTLANLYGRKFQQICQ